jgi:hypothetical protein
MSARKIFEKIKRARNPFEAISEIIEKILEVLEPKRQKSNKKSQKK